MPELTATHVGLLVVIFGVGVVLGWLFRADRCAREKMAVNASWQEQIESQQSEHNRLAEQNTSLMDQISQYQASHKESANRAKELSDSLKDTYARRDELQSQLKDMRSSLDVAVAQRDKLKGDMRTNGARQNNMSAQLKDKDDKIFRLSRELTTWQNRVPPLVERFQERDQYANELEEQLQVAQQKIEILEKPASAEHTRIEPLDKDTLPDGMDASNEQYPATAINDVSELHDQIHQSVPTGQHASLEDSGFRRTNNFSASDEDISDDLQAIKGVGPAIEKTLHDLGFFRFAQIAEMSEVDIDRVARQLKGFRSRIYREDWIGQARDLQYRKTNDLN